MLDRDLIRPRVRVLEPGFGDLHVMEHLTLVVPESGSGAWEVDFQLYFHWQEKAFFLHKGQYIRFLAHDFRVRFIELAGLEYHPGDAWRVLFKHLVSLGHIDCHTGCIGDLAIRDRELPEVQRLVSASTDQWYRKDPFRAAPDEYRVLFDVKDGIDERFVEKGAAPGIIRDLGYSGEDVNRLFLQKVGIGVPQLLVKRRIQAAQQALAFNGHSIKEIRYKLGFADASLFNRQFKHYTGITPKIFREKYRYAQSPSLFRRFHGLVMRHHRRQATLGFYAATLNMSLSHFKRELAAQMHDSPAHWLRTVRLQTACRLLNRGDAVADVAEQLHFPEAHHFTAFFKRYTGITPGQHKRQKGVLLSESNS